MFLLHIGDKGVKLTFIKTESPPPTPTPSKTSSPSDSEQSPGRKALRAQPPRLSLVVLGFVNQFSRDFQS